MEALFSVEARNQESMAQGRGLQWDADEARRCVHRHIETILRPPGIASPYDALHGDRAGWQDSTWNDRDIWAHGLFFDELRAFAPPRAIAWSLVDARSSLVVAQDAF